MQDGAKLGDRVRIAYSRVPKPGAKNTNARAPKVLEFTVGSDDIIPSVSLGVVGMAQGDQKRMSFQPETEDNIVPKGLGEQTPLQRSQRRFSLRVRKPRAAADAEPGVQHSPMDAKGTPGTAVVELDVTLVTLDASATANKQMPQFELGGEG